MKYRNLKTQAVIETACKISGGNWVEVEEKQPVKVTETAETAEVVKRVPVKKQVKKTPAKKTPAKKTTAKTTTKTVRKKSGE